MIFVRVGLNYSNLVSESNQQNINYPTMMFDV